MNSHQPSPDKSPPVLRTAAQSALPFGIEQILAMPIQQRANASSTQEQIGLAGQSSQIFPYVMAYMLSSIHQQQQQQQQQQLQAAVAAAAGLHRSPANLLSCLSAHRLPQPSQQQLQQQQSQLHQRLHQIHQLPAQRQPFNIQHNSHLHLQQQMFNKVDHGHQQRSMHQLPVQREPVNLQNNQIDMEIDLRGNEEVQAEKLDNLKPAHSYIGLIGMCILSSPEKRMVLNDIYQFILDNYPYYRNRGSGWRNSVRHNLSLNECFQKAGRAANGKGHYWTIHPANMEDFMLGDFRRRRAQRKVRRWNNMDVPSDESDDESMEDASKPPLPEHFKRSLEMHRRLELSQYRQEQI